MRILYRYKRYLDPNEYGFLYNWYVASNVNIAPVGWHVASNDEWNTLTMATYSPTILSYQEGDITYPFGNGSGDSEKVTNRTQYLKYYDSALGGIWDGGSALYQYVGVQTDNTGLDIKPSGIVSNSGAFSGGAGLVGAMYANFWTSETESLNTGADVGKYKNIGNVNNDIFRSRNFYDKRYGFSVRLVRDTAANLGDPDITVTDSDGNIYTAKVMKHCVSTSNTSIVYKYWITSNYKCTKYNNNTAIPFVLDPTSSDWTTATTGKMTRYLL